MAPERIRILKHPTPDFAVSGARESGSRPKNLPDGDFVFYPAQFWSHKNHLLLIKTAARLKEMSAPISVALVGSDKGNRAHVEAEAKRLGVEVHFLGFVSRPELVYLYKNALALAYASLCGPENLPPLEAMALGCPVIAADTLGAREQLGEAAHLLPGFDPDAWAEALSDWKKDPRQRASLIERGRERALSYTGEHFLRDLEAIFSEFAEYRALWP